MPSLYDPRYLAAAREALQRHGWRSGYGIHLDGQSTWNGVDDSLVMSVPDRSVGGVPPEFLGVYDDPLEFAAQLKKQSALNWILMLVRNRLMSIRMSRKVQGLRNEAGG